eukprot:6482141-Prymnesium_polylepis.1
MAPVPTSSSRPSEAAEQAAQDAPGERMRGCGPVPSPQVSMTSSTRGHFRKQCALPHTSARPRPRALADGAGGAAGGRGAARRRRRRAAQAAG